MPREPLDLRHLKVCPLSQRKSMSRLEDVLVQPDAPLPHCPEQVRERIENCALTLRQARERGAGAILLYGAHLVKNGAMPLVGELMADKWITHLATNGAGSIHDWEFAFLGRSTECVRSNVATGTFGTWDETGKYIHLALLHGALNNLGYGASLGRFIQEEGLTLPTTHSLEDEIRRHPADPLTPARATLLQAMLQHSLPAGPHKVPHPWKQTSIFAGAFRQNIPLTVHPGIGYDIISNHPMFNGAAIGRAADTDFRLFSRSVDDLDHGVVLSVGSAIMAPQVFEKSISCVNNLRLQAGRPTVEHHHIHVVDLQDGGQWDWTRGEPPKDNPAYYLRFCKSFARMGGTMNYLQVDNVTFLLHLLKNLNP